MRSHEDLAKGATRWRRILLLRSSSSMRSLARQILPLCSCEVVRGEAQPQVPVHVRALLDLGCQTTNGCTATQNSPQSMRVWPGLRLIGAGGKIPKGSLWLQELPQLRAAVGGRAVVGNLQLAPARPADRPGDGQRGARKRPGAYC